MEAKQIELKPEGEGIPHVLIFPLPAQGHVNPMLQLAELLCLAGIHVTFLSNEHNRFTDVSSRFSCFPGFRFQTLSDDRAPESDRPHSLGFLLDFFAKIDTVVKPAFREFLISDRLKSDNRPPVTCIISDGNLSCTIEVAKDLGIPNISFRTISVCCVWLYICLPKLIEAGEIPLKDDADMDRLITCVPGMEQFLRGRDLPRICSQVKELNDPFLQRTINDINDSTKASALLLNTFEFLDGPLLSQIRPHFPKLYTLGPLHALLNSRRPNSSPTFSSNNGVWEIDRSCMAWLDSQPLKSVVYVSFGSIIKISRNELLEFWNGLVNSGKPFLWVIRPDIIETKQGDCEIPKEVLEGNMEKARVVGWCPQEEVLSHPSVGGFLTHSGWNSTLESVAAGVPMICWPYFSDQLINSRFVGEVWKIGLDMKVACDRSTVEKMVRDLMDERREEIMTRTEEMAEMAKRSVSKGGSSYCDLEELIKDIKSNTLSTAP